MVQYAGDNTVKATPANLRNRAQKIRNVAYDGERMAERWEPKLNRHQDNRREIVHAFEQAKYWAYKIEALLDQNR